MRQGNNGTTATNNHGTSSSAASATATAMDAIDWVRTCVCVYINFIFVHRPGHYTPFLAIMPPIYLIKLSTFFLAHHFIVCMRSKRPM